MSAADDLRLTAKLLAWHTEEAEAERVLKIASDLEELLEACKCCESAHTADSDGDWATIFPEDAVRIAEARAKLAGEE